MALADGRKILVEGVPKLVERILILIWEHHLAGQQPVSEPIVPNGALAFRRFRITRPARICSICNFFEFASHHIGLQQSPKFRLPPPPSPRYGPEERSGMEGAYCSTV